MRKYFPILLVIAISSDAQNTRVIDSLLTQLKKSNDSAKVNIYNSLSHEYRNSDLNKTDSFTNLSIQLATISENNRGLGYAYISKGELMKNTGDYIAAIGFFRQALTLFVSCGSRAGYAAVYNQIASVYFLQSKYVHALSYYFRSLQISDELNDRQGMAKTLNNIGAVYEEQKEFRKAIEYFSQAYKILESIDLNQAADCLNNLGTVYQFLGDTAQAARNYRKSMDINRKLGDKRDVSSILLNIGFMYFQGGQYKLALELFFESLEIDEQLGDVRGMSTCFGNITDCYIRLKMYHAADLYAKRMLQVANDYEVQTDIIDAYRYLNRIQEETGNFKEALEYHKLYKAYSDSVYNEENRDAQTQLETKYRKEKSEKENYINGKEQELKAFLVKQKNKEMSNYILLIGLVLLLFVLIIYIVFFLIRRNKFS